MPRRVRENAAENAHQADEPWKKQVHFLFVWFLRFRFKFQADFKVVKWAIHLTLFLNLILNVRQVS